jgi:DNA polymerase-3 subunit delta'
MMARASYSQEIDSYPEADRLEGFPHPRETKTLFGHETAEHMLARTLEAGRMPHGWILAGPAGIGKATLAYRLARYALAAPGDRSRPGESLEVAANSRAARQVAALAHPRLLVVRRPFDPRSKRFSLAIPVDEVRRLKSFLALTVEEEAWRVVIVDSANELNVNAANALLKSIEEPPPRSLFLLIASEPSALLPTIRSRCRLLRLKPLTGESVRRAAEAALSATGRNVPTGPDLARIEQLANGSVRRALQLAAEGGVDLYDRLAAILNGLPRLDWQQVHTLAESLAPAAAEQRFETFYALLLDLLARLVRARATGGGDREEVALAQRLIAHGRLASWAALWETVLREKTEAAALNLDRRVLIVRTFARLEGLSRR